MERKNSHDNLTPTAVLEGNQISDQDETDFLKDLFPFNELQIVNATLDEYDRVVEEFVKAHRMIIVRHICDANGWDYQEVYRLILRRRG